MSLALTPETLAAAYEYLRTTAPFKRWKLPPADEVEFHVARLKDRAADHSVVLRPEKLHTIRVSSANVKTTDGLLEVMAHEMVHAYQDGVARTGSRRVDHNKEFIRLSALVCKTHGWQLSLFIE